MDRSVTTIILIASLLASGSLFASTSAAFWERASMVMEESAVRCMAFQMAAGAAEAASEAAQSGTAVKTYVIFSEEALVEASGTSITVVSTFKGSLINASVSLMGRIDIQPSKISSSSFIVTAYPNGTAIISVSGQRAEGI
ncbi:MAG: hypothetical protein Metus_0031 [Candidatus Methanosuratincola subterraneus]|uniref:Uncharacterized protein n=1 Tax=Methanosuratincola subterraneus TaxID=2593994 RepID=A0A3S3S8M4_METS7|nr:MAG: hypothetical protein Metus_0031 [Candidatus Methanosuratincola subterraneus]